MTDASQPTEEGRPNSFVKELSSAAAKRALAPIAATAATAGTAYLTRKAKEIWQEKVLPKLREKGGAKAVARDTLEKGADLLGGPGSEALTGLAQRLGDERAAQQQPASPPTSQSEPDGQREEERRKRQQRRQQRQRTLEQSGST